jgi:hypothetical protein
MSEIKPAVQAAQPATRDAPTDRDRAANDPIQLTDLELMLAGGGDTITPWP